MQIRYIVLAVLFFSIGQSMAWMQMNAPILWSSFNRYKWILILLGIPVTWIFMTATQYAVSGFEGNLWPGRILSFVTGIITFTILTWAFKGEVVNMKTAVCLVLSVAILLIQVFWK
jgi:hypothetical protein